MLRKGIMKFAFVFLKLCLPELKFYTLVHTKNKLLVWGSHLCLCNRHRDSAGQHQMLRSRDICAHMILINRILPHVVSVAVRSAFYLQLVKAWREETLGQRAGMEREFLAQLLAKVANILIQKFYSWAVRCTILKSIISEKTSYIIQMDGAYSRLHYRRTKACILVKCDVLLVLILIAAILCDDDTFIPTWVRNG